MDIPVEKKWSRGGRPVHIPNRRLQSAARARGENGPPVPDGTGALKHHGHQDMPPFGREGPASPALLFCRRSVLFPPAASRVPLLLF
ncbi:hypothetical protein Cadr_000030495, partial [Camelus dromedarius]